MYIVKSDSVSKNLDEKKLKNNSLKIVLYYLTIFTLPGKNIL